MTSRSATACRSSDEVLDHVLDEITARLQAGESLDIEICVAEHPEYADQLRRLLPAMQMLAAVGDSPANTSVGPPRGSIDSAGVLGDFRIMREIGRGGMGVVYEAEQLSIGRSVALKVLPFASIVDERRIARFHIEVRAAGQLHHTNIVPIYAVGADRGVHFFAMQLVDGQTVAEMINDLRGQAAAATPTNAATSPAANRFGAAETERAALSTVRINTGATFCRTAAQFFAHAAEALEHAHSHGVIHRDIKPSNLMVDARGTLYLTDFGLASIETDANLTMTGDLLGTLRYMSPEQTRGSRVVLDHRTDVYSLGVTLYELLTLELAFDAPDRQQLVQLITEVEPRAPRRLNPAIPPDLETIVLKAMAKEAGSRYATAQDMADDLHRFLANKPIEARRPTLVERARKWSRRHAALMGMGVAALAAVAVVGSVATMLTLWAYRSEARQRAVAEANLAVASKSIDRLLSRVADDRYWHGDLAHAESLASDATVFYDELLKHSDDPDLRFRAAQAHGSAAHIWELVGRHEQAGLANRRAGELLLKLTTSFPDQPKYLAALAANYNRIGLVDWSLDRPIAAEPSFRQAWEIWTELADRFPSEPLYQSGVADMLANLGSVCYFSDRFEVAEEYYRRAEAIKQRLPDELKNSATGLASQAGSCTNQAELARLRGQYDRALELLAQSIPLHKQSLDKWPTNPVTLDCYYHTHWNIVECQLGAERPVEAAAAVDRLVETFPDRLQALHEGATQLLSCATIAVDREPPGASPTTSAGTSPSQAYRQRAHELIARAPDAHQRTPDAVDRFAWFLLTCDDESFRDARQARELAISGVKEVPERGVAWFTLALAHFRNGDWQAAEEADQTSIRFSPGGNANVYDWVLLAMIRFKQGRIEIAHQQLDQADNWISENKPKDQDLLRLAAEAEELIQSANPEPTKSITSAEKPQ